MGAGHRKFRSMRSPDFGGGKSSMASGPRDYHSLYYNNDLKQASYNSHDIDDDLNVIEIKAKKGRDRNK